jgi:hypothetical protein
VGRLAERGKQADRVNGEKPDFDKSPNLLPGGRGRLGLASSTCVTLRETSRSLQQTNSKTRRIGVISALSPVVDGTADGSGAYGGCADAPTRIGATTISACMVDAACMMDAARMMDAATATASR